MGVSSEKQNNAEPQPVGDSETQSDNSISDTTAHEDLIEPTEEDIANLRHTGSKIQATAWLVALFSGAERFAFYALQAPLQNYIQNPRENFGRPGALDMGQSVATALNSFLRLLCFTTPVFAGVLADGHWGPYKTLVVSCGIYLAGILLLLLTSIPPALGAGAGLGGLIGAFVLIGCGVGGVKSSVAPFTADQVGGGRKHVATLETGERVIVDPELTVRRVYSIFYWCNNVGALSGLASTSMEKFLDFWTSFLLALGALAFGTLVLILGHHKFFRRRPEASFRAKLLSALACVIKGGFRIDAAQPTEQLEKHGRVVPWDEQFVEDLRQALQACKVWAIYPIVWLCYDQNQTNLISQAGQMLTHGIPNDALASLNPICVLIIIPITEKFIYPYMQKFKLSPRATVRMTLGFALVAASMAVAAGVQHVVYSAPPCYDMPLHCPESDNGRNPNRVSVGIQVPVHVIGALGEVLWSVSGSEYAYNKAAPHMKSTLQAVTMLTVALNSVLGLAVSPAARNPYLTILFASFAGAMTVTSVGFGWLFWNSD
ncbi:PTR2-domain-containing protein [Aspergillus steynii IBT 23096]|uniref:PTR2-domain-containing protein n=1 Tax=Aspergillus steynii IBT 23096 TaxID=1392250 RepID=A0A2I2GS27_9EURO|nr:PTR2-domain-containing protein [Aspergillus steynii IBT 23096]PLB55681.1 PTR2-domain-containing protein [Aspergillus steynii IBT 23096]